MNHADAPTPTIAYRRTTDLALYERNARTHSPEQVEEIGRLIDQFGWTFPILADASGIVAGHGRLAAAGNLYAAGKTLKWPDGTPIPAGFVPVLPCDGWPEDKRRAYILADNKVPMNAGWSMELLRAELEWLKDDGFDLSLTGFHEDELQAIFEPVVLDNDRDPDAAPDKPEVPHTVPGDVWELGPHRVVCGDSTSVDNWQSLLGGELLDAVWTDPPYNVAYESKLAGKIKNDDMKDGDFLDLLRGIHGALFTVMKPGAAIYVAHADTEGLNFRKAFVEAGFKLSGCLIWRKDSLVLGRSDYQWQHEPILYGWKPGSRHRWFGGRKNTTIQDIGPDNPFHQQADGTWAIKVGDQFLVVAGDARVVNEFPSTLVRHEKPKRSANHPTMKPVGLIEKNLRFSARSGDLIGDACGGSGSTLIAADRLGMCARISELDPKFVDVIVRRWQNYTGRVATLRGTDKPFPVPPNTAEAF